MGIFDISLVDQRQTGKSGKRETVGVSVFEEFLDELRARKVLQFAIRVERFLPFPPFVCVSDSEPVAVSDFSKEDFIKLTNPEPWVRRQTVLLVPGPGILMSPLLNEAYTENITSLGFRSFWSSKVEDLEKLVRENVIDVALEWHDAKNSPVLDIVRRWQLQCPVLLCRNRGVCQESEAFQLGYDGIFGLPDGSPAELMEEALRGMARWRNTNRKHLQSSSLLSG